MQKILEHIPELNDIEGIFAKDALTTLGLLLEGKAYAIRSIFQNAS